MHAAIVHLSPILAAEKSKTPFYIVGGALVVWALIVSLGLGLREGGFPRTLAAQRIVIAVTAVLVLGAVSMAVATSGGSTKVAQAAGSATNTGTQSGAASQSPGGSTPATTPSTPSTSATPSPSTGGTHAPSGGAAQAQTKLLQAADPSGQLRFAKTSLTAKTGKVSIEFTNSSPLPHNLTIASGSTVLGATPTFNGGAKTLILKLKPGTYKFYCSVPGHREAGMEGTLVVR